jgi:vancomycin permeability regulator SanA
MRRNLNKKTLYVFLVVILIVFVYFVSIPVSIIYFGKKQVYTNIEDVDEYNVGIVFGAGVKEDGTPHDMLRDRLIVASDLYNAGKIKKILVSGDNRFVNYNEPQVMFEYLTEDLKIPADDVVRDYAGRRTYDTCARAKEIFGVENALLITQGYHLPRTIYTCEKLGIESEGYSGTLDLYVGDKFYKTREVLAIYKAWFDVNISKPSYVGGEFEVDLDE